MKHWNAFATRFAWLYRLTVRRCLLGLLLILLLLAACAAPGEEPSRSTATLAPPSATVEPTARSTTAPPEETAVVPQATPSVEEATAGETLTPLQAQLGLPAGTTIALHQTGGFAGVDNLWVLYDDGRIDTPDGGQIAVAQEEVEAQLAALDAAGFFEMEQPKTEPICCDYFTYMLYAHDGERENAITVSGGDPSLSPELLEIIQALTTLATGAETS